MHNHHICDILIIGGSLGGVAAALSAARLGQRVILTEETDWLGGQLTTQAVPPDEHPWIESTGCTASYRRFREGVRAYVRRAYPLTTQARQDPRLNPGQGYVSALCHEPRVALAVLYEMLAPYLANGQLTLLLCHRPTSVALNGDRVEAVTLLDGESGNMVTLSAPFILDATELGDLLALGHVEHIIGAESQAETGEPHAVDGPAQPLDQQAVTWCFAVDYLPEGAQTGDEHLIEKPAQYDFWRGYTPDFWSGPLFSWTYTNPFTLEPIERPIFLGEPSTSHALDFWHYRRILWQGHGEPGALASDICAINWPMNDYWLGPLLGVDEATKRLHLEGAKQVSLSFLYWMQRDAPRHDGGYGYPGLRLRPDVVGTTPWGESQGLAKQVYVRESRRIQAEMTVVEQHVGVAARGDLVGAEVFDDSVGVGSYRIDLHPSTGPGPGQPRTYIDIANYPFQIPLGALIPVRVENLLPACKNLGVTHITNGCYRLHPVEWTIGEAAGALAAFCLANQLMPRQVRHSEKYLADFQRLLTGTLGFVLAWPDYIRKIAR